MIGHYPKRHGKVHNGKLSSAEERHMKKIIAENINRLREEADVSQQQLALAIGCYSDSYIGKLERGLKTPTIKTLFRIAKALNVNVVEFLR